MSIFLKINKLLTTWRYKPDHALTKKKKTILFWVPGGMPLMLHVEGAIAAALKLRDFNVHAIICDGPFRACILRDINDDVSISNWQRKCVSCRKQTSTVLKKMGVPFSFIGDYVPITLWKKLWTTIRLINFKKITDINYGSINISKNIQSSIMRYLKGENLEGHEEIIREYIYSGLISAAAAANAIDKIKPMRIFMSHGTYIDWGPALSTALFRGIPITAWMASYLPALFYFRNIENNANIDFHGLSDSAWEKCKNKNLLKKQTLRLNRYLENRYKHNISFDMKQFRSYTGRQSIFRKKYKLNRDKPLWGIMAHINWDAVCDYSPMIYDSFNDWILDTIKEIVQIKNIQWLIKIHPAEVWENTRSGVQKLIERHFPSLPKHIHIIAAEEEMNPLDFIQLIDGGVTVYGTLGLELALYGKPVILTGEAHYGRKGFTFDCQNITSYKNLLKRVNTIGPLNEKQKKIAQNYAYRYFIQRQIPIPVVKDPESVWWKFNYKKRDLLIPGQDPFMDFVCDRIIDGQDFIMDENMVDLADKM